MFQILSGNQSARNIAIVTVVLMVTGSLFWLKNRHHPMPPNSTAAIQMDDVAKKLNVQKMDEKTMEALQAEAATSAVTAKPVSGTLTARPEFVSEIEWQILNGVAGQMKDKDAQLTNLINKLLFAKKREAWQIAGDQGLKKTLALQLLDMIPDQVRANSMDEAQSQKMKQAFLASVNVTTP